MNARTMYMYRQLLVGRSIQELKFHDKTGDLEYIIISGGKLEIHLTGGDHHLHDFRGSCQSTEKVIR